MVEDLLRMRREAKAGNPPSLHDAYRAASHCARLAEALLAGLRPSSDYEFPGMNGAACRTSKSARASPGP